MRTIRVVFGSSLLLLVAALLFLQPGSKPFENQDGARSPAGAQDISRQSTDAVIVSDPVEPDLTIPARDAPPVRLDPKLDREINPRVDPYGRTDPGYRIEGGPDPLLDLQAGVPAGQATGFDTPIFNFEGQGFTGVNPPDTVGDIGSNHYMQMVNATIVSIYDKTDASLVSRFDLTTLGGCATGGGDPIVLYDHLADRWLLSEFGPGNSLCVFISQSPDPTGAYFSYQFSTPNFPDYPKYGVWPDAYYVTTNESGPANYALDRDEMLLGNPATSQRFTAPPLSGFGFQTLTPADLDGPPPPAGAPGYYMRHRDTEAHGPAGFPTEDFLEVWAFSVDWANPGNSSFTQVANVSVAEFDSDICGLTAFNGIPMPGVSKCSFSSLDPLREVVMFRLQYRNFGSHGALVGNLVTDVTGNDDAGVRWFELRKVGAGSWSLHQEGTYAPDGDGRWMGAIAMDGSGNIALGYNVSGAATFPSLRYAGRLATDPLGTLPQGEYLIVNGNGVNGSNRYGDYSAMGVDPEDDCTFWFTGEYNPTSQWSTRIAAFRFDACGGADFTLSAEPDSLDLCTGTDAIYDLTIGSIQGYSDPVTLSTQGEPAGTSANFSINPVIPPGTSVLTIGNTGGATPGNYNVDIVGVAPTSTHTTTVGLHVFDMVPGAPVLTDPANGATNVPTEPTFMWQAAAQAASYDIEIATDAGFTNIVDAATVDGTSYTAGVVLNTSTTYYWHVQANNACGTGSFSATWSFTTEAAPGDCGPGTAPNQVFFDDLESGAPGWTTGGSSSTWGLGAGVSPGGPISGANVYHADDVSFISDQHLISPPVVLPTGEAPLTLQFWNYQEMEDGGASCYDGGVLEISDDGGATWTRLESELLTDPYDGPIDSGFGNPLAGQNAWCGDPQDWLNSIVDIDAWAGDTVQFRWRLATDSSVSHPGWDLDDIEVQSCMPAGAADIAVDPASLSATQEPDTTTMQMLDISNVGTADLNWTIEEADQAGCDAPTNVTWLAANPAAGTTVSGTTDMVAVTFDSTGLSPDSYTATLCINSNDLDTPRVEIPVSLSVSEYHLYLPVMLKEQNNQPEAAAGQPAGGPGFAFPGIIALPVATFGLWAVSRSGRKEWDNYFV